MPLPNPNPYDGINPKANPQQPGVPGKPFGDPGVPGQYGPHGGINPQGAPPPAPVKGFGDPGVPGQYGPHGGINPQGQPPPPATKPVAPPQPAPWTPAPTPPPTLPPPQNPGPQAPPAQGQPWYGQQDITNYQAWAKNRYGREATASELAQIGANSTDMASAQAYSDSLAKGLGWAGPAGAAAPAAPSMEQQNQDLLQKRIQELLGTKIGDVDTTTQEYQSQRGAFDRGQGRAMETAKRNAASRRGASGNSGGFDSQMETLDSEAAGMAGNFEAQLATQQIGRQREDLQMALQMAQQSGMADEARALQEKLAQSDIELRKYLGKGQLGLGMLGTLLGNQRAQDALGFNYAQLGNQVNQQTLQQLLAGL
jgi:hypothetical protein